MFEHKSKLVRAAKTDQPARQPVRGNMKSVPSWMNGYPLRRKLVINQPSDQYEQEADHVASQVMRSSEPADVQRKSDSVAGSEAPPSVHQTLNQSGQPLDAGTRNLMESRFGQDFSEVRVHTDSQAAQSAADVSARAYTVGNNLVFGGGEYAPSTSEGQRLIAHELTHTIQQTQAVGVSRVALPENILESSADQAANIANIGQASLPNSPLALQRAQLSRAPKRPHKTSPSRDIEYSPVDEEKAIKLLKAVGSSEASDWGVDEWHVVAASIKSPAVINLISAKGKQLFDPLILTGLSFENITQDQRIVFAQLPEIDREQLRIAALKNSKLFKGITDTHVPYTTSDPDLKKTREDWTNKRLIEDKSTITSAESSPSEAVAESDSAAYALTYSAAVDSAMTFAGKATDMPNKELATWVQSENSDKVGKKLHTYACGFTNLYALAFAYGTPTSSPGRPPTLDDIAKWLQLHTLGTPPAKSLVNVYYKLSQKSWDDLKKRKVLSDAVLDKLKPLCGLPGMSRERFITELQKRLGKAHTKGISSIILAHAGSLSYNPRVILDMKKSAKVFDNPYRQDVPHSDVGAHQKFQAFMSDSASSVGFAPQLALAQGVNETHSFLIYKDIDNIWRTMDIYLKGEDYGSSKLGFPRRSKKIVSVNFLTSLTVE